MRLHAGSVADLAWNYSTNQPNLLAGLICFAEDPEPIERSTELQGRERL